MDPKTFVSARAGRAVKTLTGYWAFVPLPLPPAIVYDNEARHGIRPADLVAVVPAEVKSGE